MFLYWVFKERREQSASDGLFKDSFTFLSNRENARELGPGTGRAVVLITYVVYQRLGGQFR